MSEYTLEIRNPLGPNIYEAGTSLSLDGKLYFLDFETMEYAYTEAPEPGIRAIRLGAEGLIDDLFIVTLDAPYLELAIIEDTLPLVVSVLRKQHALFPADQNTFKSFADLQTLLATG